MTEKINNNGSGCYMIGCAVIGGRTAIFVGDDAELNVDKFTSVNCEQTLKTGSRTKVNFLNSTVITLPTVQLRKRWPWSK